MLCGVLLHMIESPRPVQSQPCRPRLHGAFQVVVYVLINALDINYRHLAKHADVGRLSAALRIQDRVIED